MVLSRGKNPFLRDKSKEGDFLNSSTYIVIFVLIYLVIQKRKKIKLCALNILRRKKGGQIMLELAKALIGKECIIFTISDANVCGVLEAVSGNAIRVRGKKSTEIINLDLVVRNRELPVKKYAYIMRRERITVLCAFLVLRINL